MDGGLDAIVERDGIAFIIQSKYERTGKVSPIPRGEISDFENIARKFQDPSYLDEYVRWRDRKVRPEIRPLYNKVRKSAIERPESVRFLFVTPKRSEDHDNGAFEIEDIQNVSALWYLFAEGFTPPTEHIELELNSWWPTSVEGKYKTYVGLADVLDFLKLMSRDVNERLFAQNVRTNLGSPVNERIRNTYEKQPEIFWLCNNGIYIVCSKVTSHGNLHRLTYPSVINGSQTLHAIAESNLRHSCRILVRILEMDVLGDSVLLSAVITRTNSQNKMNYANLYAHDVLQLNVARYLDRYKIFYERREKEWKNEKKPLLTEYLPVGSKKVAQWLSTLDRTIGLGSARGDVQAVFEEHYDDLFGRFDGDLQSNSYAKLAVLVWVGLFTESLFRRLPRKTAAFAKISRLLLVRAVYTSVQRSSRLRNIVQSLLKDHVLGRRHIPREITRQVKEIIEKTVAVQRKMQSRDPNLDYSNFFKRDNLVEDAYRAACTESTIRKLGRALESTAPRIG